MDIQATGPCSWAPTPPWVHLRLAGPGARPREGGWEGVKWTLSLSLPSPLLQLSLSLGTSSSVRVVEMLSLQLTLSIQSPTQNEGSKDFRSACGVAGPVPDSLLTVSLLERFLRMPESEAEREFRFMWVGPSRPACPSLSKFLTGTPKLL